jgi:hypothetical protein
MNSQAQVDFDFRTAKPTEVRELLNCDPTEDETARGGLKHAPFDLQPGDNSSAAKDLPNAPIAKTAGSEWLGDRLHLREGDSSWTRALRNPVVLTASALFVSLAAIQITKTNRCIDENKPACNLVTGKNRPLTYGVAIPLTAGIIWSAAKLKEKGQVTGFAFLLMGGLIYETTVAYNSNPHVLDCKTGRTPICQ